MNRNRIGTFVVSSLILLVTQETKAQYDWAQRTGGDSTGVYSDGSSLDWTWGWSPGGTAITGNYSFTRSGAGNTFATWETLGDTIDAGGFSSPEFNNSLFALGVGGVDGISHFLSEGELGRAPNDVPTFSTYTAQAIFTLDNGFSSPENTLITLFDPGAFERIGSNRVDGPFTYTFTASNNGVDVDTSSWGLQIEDPYLPANNTTTNITWDGTTLTVDDWSGVNFPDTLVFLDTGTTTFDSLTIDAAGMSVDTFAVGFGANSPPIPIPEVSSALLVGLGGLIGLGRRRR